MSLRKDESINRGGQAMPAVITIEGIRPWGVRCFVIVATVALTRAVRWILGGATE